MLQCLELFFKLSRPSERGDDRPIFRDRNKENCVYYDQNTKNRIGDET